MALTLERDTTRHYVRVARALPPSPLVLRGTEAAMRRIIQANIDRLKELLKTELDPTRRAMENKLLAEEKAKLTQEPKDKKAAF